VQIEFLESGSDDCPLIRIFGTGQEGFRILLQATRQLARTEGDRCAVHDMQGFGSVADCKLIMISSSKDEGVRRVRNTNEFTWVLTPESWDDAACLIEPFASEAQLGTFQWLAGPNAPMDRTSSPLSILLSCSREGRW
jgi:hypothetical protein